MDYRKIYDSIIQNAKERNLQKNQNIIVETHHIVPKSCGGSNCKDNLVTLLPKEHYICHLLLERMYKNTEYHAKMQRAVFFMIRYGSKNSRVYKSIKEAHIQNLKMQTLSDEHKRAISEKNKGNKSRSGMLHTEATKLKISEKTEGKKKSLELRAFWSQQRKGRTPWNKNKSGYTIENYPKNRKSRGPLSIETIEKMRLARKKWHEERGHKING